MHERQGTAGTCKRARGGRRAGGVTSLEHGHGGVGAWLGAEDRIPIPTGGSLHSVAVRHRTVVQAGRRRVHRAAPRPPRSAGSQIRQTEGFLRLLIDSTGLRIHVGHLRKPPKNRAWRKLHLAVDARTGEIVASDLTGRRTADCARVPALIEQLEDPVASAAHPEGRRGASIAVKRSVYRGTCRTMPSGTAGS